MVESTAVTEQPSCFQFKTSFSPCTIMQLTRYDLQEMEQQLETTIQKAPNFFIGSAVILDLEAMKSQTVLDLAEVKKLLLNHNMVPVGVRGGSEQQHQEAAGLGMPAIAIGAKSSTNVTSAKVEEPATQKPQAPQATAKVITTPIRSGMQIYARDCDLIVLSSVSSGAELLADGNIHIYGALRGRALAGVQGNTQARIFCRTLEAEMVAIAGYYLVKEDLQDMASHLSSVQIFLDHEKVKIAAL